MKHFGDLKLTNDSRLALEVHAKSTYIDGLAAKYVAQLFHATGDRYRVEGIPVVGKKGQFVFRVKQPAELGDWYIGCQVMIDERIGDLEHLQFEVDHLRRKFSFCENSEDLKLVQEIWEKLEDRIRVLVGGVPR